LTTFNLAAHTESRQRVFSQTLFS